MALSVGAEVAVWPLLEGPSVASWLCEGTVDVGVRLYPLECLGYVGMKITTLSAHTVVPI